MITINHYYNQINLCCCCCCRHDYDYDYYTMDEASIPYQSIFASSEIDREEMDVTELVEKFVRNDRKLKAKKQI